MQGPLHATLLMSPGAHLPGPSLIPLPGLGCPLGPTGHRHRSKRATENTSGAPGWTAKCCGQQLWVKFRGLVSKAEPIRFNPYTVPPPTDKGPRNPKACNTCPHHQRQGPREIRAQMSPGAAFRGTTLRLKRKNGKLGTFSKQTSIQISCPQTALMG